jgi:hypothetical protein
VHSAKQLIFVINSLPTSAFIPAPQQTHLAELTFRRIIVFVALLVMLLPALEAPYGLWGNYNVCTLKK